ncbi:hypothetical protein AADG42_16545 [Ammonicoccus fulvus]|uniref:Uncharacterized protein n=1 Tax=Ammonicoccus fulvus TaxID=3138240 RepID=A0ABZ3FRZ5_9ACTN
MKSDPGPGPVTRGPLALRIALALLWALWICWLVYWLLASDQTPPGVCNGLGFGCVPDPKFTALLFALIYLLPATALAVLVVGIVRVAQIVTASRTGRYRPTLADGWALLTLVAVGGLLFWFYGVLPRL